MGAIGGMIDNITGGNTFGGNSNESALQSQTAATQQAMGSIRDSYNSAQSTLKPWESTGQQALGQLAGNNFMSGFSGSPALQFQLDQASKATNNAMANRGLGNSGAALMALQDRAQGIASQDYQQQYQNEMNRLGLLAGYGSNAANNMSNNSIGYGSNIASLHTGLGNAQAASAMGRANQQGNFVNQLYSNAGAALGMFSDKRLKKNIRPITKEEREEIGKVLKAYHFNYLSDEHGSGDWIGVMAQDLEKSKIGKLLVVENEQGLKTIDTNKVMSMFLAYMAEAA